MLKVYDFCLVLNTKMIFLRNNFVNYVGASKFSLNGYY